MQLQRSSSKLLARAETLRHMNKPSYKFRFTFDPESLDKVHTAKSVALFWEQTGGSALKTEPVAVSGDHIANFVGQTLERDVTLYKKRGKCASIEFEEKVQRLVVRSDGPDGRAFSRIDINLADYVDVPSFSKRVAAVMSHGGRLVMNITSSLVGEAKSSKKKRLKKNKKKTNKAVGGQHSSSNQGSSGADSAYSLDEPWNSETDPDSVGGSRDDVPEELDDDFFDLSTPMPEQTSGTAKRAGSAGMKLTKAAGQKSDETADGHTVNTGKIVKHVPSGGVVTKATMSVTSEKREEQVRKDSTATSVARDTIERLAEENRDLRTKLAEAQERLSREPVYKDVLRELSEAKMALAMVTLEKDELINEVRELKRKTP